MIGVGVVYPMVLRLGCLGSEFHQVVEDSQWYVLEGTGCVGALFYDVL